MNRGLILSAVVVALVATGGVVRARVPDAGAKMRGDYGRMARTRSSYRSYAPVRVAPPAVASVPDEGRRYSYAPAEQESVGSPCESAPAAPAEAASAARRRYSYAPETSGEATYYNVPSRGRRTTPPAWALPKTDPRKYQGGR